MYYELVMFTTLPRNFVDRLLKMTPGLDQVVSTVLCYEDTTQVEDFVVKDISILLLNRELQDIFVVDTNPDHVQDDIVASIHPDPFDGLIPYTQLTSLVKSLKQSRKHIKEDEVLDITNTGVTEEASHQ